MVRGSQPDIQSPFLLEALAPARQEEAPADLVPQLAALWQRLSPSARRRVERALVMHLVDSGVRDRGRLMGAVASLRHPGRVAGSAEAEALGFLSEHDPGEREEARDEADAGATWEAETADQEGEDEWNAEADEECETSSLALGEEYEDEELESEGYDREQYDSGQYEREEGEAEADEAEEDEATPDEEDESGPDFEDEDASSETVADEEESPFPEVATKAAGETEALAGWDEVFAEEGPHDEAETDGEGEAEFEAPVAGEPEVEGETPTPAQIQASLKAIRIASTTHYLRRAPNAVDLNAIASKNTPSKRGVFKALQETWRKLQTLGRQTASGAQAEKALQNRRAQLEEELQKQARALKEWLETNALGHNRALAQVAGKVKALKSKLSRTRNAAQAEAVRGALQASEAAAQALRDQLTAAARAYEPLKDLARKVHEVRVPSRSGEVVVKLHDNVVAFATDTAAGLDGNAEGDGPAGVDAALARSGISEDKRAILKILSRLEGRFSTVNTWDRAVITFGFTQWTTGASGDGTLCDLMEAVRGASPEAYRLCFQQYGLDLERPGSKRRHFMVTLPDGSVLRAGDAARRVQTSVPHVAALSAAGMDSDVQTAQIKFAVEKKIDGMLANRLSARGTAARLGDLLTSVHAVGVVTDRAAGTGEYGTRDAAQRGFEAYLKAHPDADFAREADRRAAGTRVLAELVGLDRRRASEYAGLDNRPGSFSA